MPGNRWTQIWWLVSGWNRRMPRPWPMVFRWWAGWQDLMSARYWAKYTHGPASIPWQDLKIRYFGISFFRYFSKPSPSVRGHSGYCAQVFARPDEARRRDSSDVKILHGCCSSGSCPPVPWWIKPSFFASDWKTGSSWPPSIFTLPMQLKHSQSLAHLVYLVLSSMSCFTGSHSKYLKLAWRLVRAFVYWCASRWPSHHAAKANANHRCWNQR